MSNPHWIPGHCCKCGHEILIVEGRFATSHICGPCSRGYEPPRIVSERRATAEEIAEAMRETA